MKKLLLPVILLLGYSAFAQNTDKLLNEYYSIKDALVNSNATEAARAAKELSVAVNNLPAESTGANKGQEYKALQKKISSAANNIAAGKDLVKQRGSFQELSESVITLVKKQKQGSPAYIMYCPMKKAYWISQVEQVKNPYYGNSMLTCGNITETLN